MISLLSTELVRLNESRHYLIAYSGGIDSHVLLYAMAKWREQNPAIRLRAIHVHHGLSNQANDWLSHCENVCHELNITFLSEKITIADTTDSLEAAARHARYRALAQHLAETECLLTAHNQDDQAETVLLQLLRGAGPKGLAAMPFKKPFAHTVHLRPLLKVTRSDIHAYAMSQQLQWVEDDSNSDERFDRNYLRHRVIPLLQKRWPSVTKNLMRSAQHCGHAAELLMDLAEDDFCMVHGTQANTLSISGLMQLSETRRANLLRYWLYQLGCRAPSTQQLKQLQQDVLQCDSDAMPVFELGSKILRRYRDDLYCLSTEVVDTELELQWDCRLPLSLPFNLGTLHPDQFPDFQRLTVRFRRGGESIKPVGSAYTQPLKKLFQQWGVPPWQRDRIPLLFDKDRLVAVLGYCYSEQDRWTESRAR